MSPAMLKLPAKAAESQHPWEENKIQNQQHDGYNVQDTIQNYLTHKEIGKYGPFLREKTTDRLTPIWQLLELAGEAFKAAIIIMLKESKENMLLMK